MTISPLVSDPVLALLARRGRQLRMWERAAMAGREAPARWLDTEHALARTRPATRPGALAGLMLVREALAAEIEDAGRAGIAADWTTRLHHALVDGAVRLFSEDGA